MTKILLQYASFLGATGIAAGAFGAHALKDTLERKNSLGYWQTAVLYQLVHATAMLGLASTTTAAAAAASTTTTGAAAAKTVSRAIMVGNLWTAGVVMFSGSLYGLALDIGPKAVLGPTTPIGGLCMIGGWVVVAFL